MLRIVEIKELDSRKRRVIVEGDSYGELEFVKVANLLRDELGTNISFEPPYPDACYVVNERGEKIPINEVTPVRKFRFEFNIWVR